MPGKLAPERSRTWPNAAYSGKRLSITAKTASYSATSMYCPLPPFTFRWYIAMSAPIVPYSDASVSPRLTPTRTGGRSGNPVTYRSPHALGDCGESGAVSIGARLPVSADAEHHNDRIYFPQVFPPEPEAFHGAGPEVLYQYVGRPDQIKDKLPA